MRLIRRLRLFSSIVWRPVDQLQIVDGVWGPRVVRLDLRTAWDVACIVFD